MNTETYSLARATLILVLLSFVGACATTSGQEKACRTIGSNADPWEKLNRGVYHVNDGLDTVFLRPLATGYEKATPQFMRRGVGNFFSNLRRPLTIVNQLLQGKGRAALHDTGRLLVNSTVGVGGLFDPASSFGLEKGDEDFGQTLAVWGVPEGPYVVVPLLGPRTLRDALSIPANFYADPLLHYDNTSVRDKLWGLQAIHVRARLLTAEKLTEDSCDPYATIRDSWLQNRRFKVYDGNPPDDDEELFDEFLDE